MSFLRLLFMFLNKSVEETESFVPDYSYFRIKFLEEGVKMWIQIVKGLCG